MNGTRRCDGNTFEVCENGSWTTVDQCPLFCSDNGCTTCDGPDCMSAECGDAMNQQSYIGCEYWAVDLDNATEVYGLPIPVAGMECSLWPSSKELTGIKVCFGPNGLGISGACDDPGDQCPAGYTCTPVPSADVPTVCALDGDHAPFAIVVSNPQANIVAVTIEVAGGQSMTTTVGPGEIKPLFPQQMGFPDQGIDGTGVFHRGYKITSNAPIVAYQFNPLNNVDVFSNDASLLLPRASFDKRYIAVSYATLTRRYANNASPGKDNYNGYVTAVAWDDDTQIEVTPTANTLGGNDGTPALLAGQQQTFTLNKFDVLNLSAVAGAEPNTNDGLNGGDLTGTVFQAVNGKTFGVFGGHEAVRISAPNSDCCADHLEEMMFPTSTWGKQFAVARTVVRRDAPDILRIVASTPNTQIGFAPLPMDGPCPVLGPSQYCDVHITAPTEVTATQPVTVAHLMMSAMLDQSVPPLGTGDPSLGIVPPVEQYRTDYKFLAPMDYDEQYVDIVAVDGDLVTLDGATVTGWTPFGTGRAAATVPISVGAHTVSCNAKCSVEVYGWSQAVSYLFAGGLDLKPIVIE